MEQEHSGRFLWLFDERSFVPVAMIKEGRAYSIMTDHLGTPTQAYDPEGNEVWSRMLDMDGNVLEEAGNIGMIPFLFQGQYFDCEIGLAYNRFRYYSPQMGIYISQDPIRLEGGVTNIYAYVNDTNIEIDIWGLTEDTLTPGPYAKESIPARSPERDFTQTERDKINEIGKKYGCHTCGSTNPKTKSGDFIPDHQPPSALNTTNGEQLLYPHCLECSRKQGGEVKLKKYKMEKEQRKKEQTYNKE